jgi:hypothetical protein
MTQESIGYADGVECPSEGTAAADSTAGIRRVAKSRRMAHTHTSRRQLRGMPRWFAVAVLTGAFVALAFVNFFAR